MQFFGMAFEILLKLILGHCVKGLEFRENRCEFSCIFWDFYDLGGIQQIFENCIKLTEVNLGYTNSLLKEAWIYLAENLPSRIEMLDLRNNVHYISDKFLSTLSTRCDNLRYRDDGWGISQWDRWK